MATMIGCPRCGKSMPLDAATCPHCSARPTDPPETRQPSAFVVAETPRVGLFHRMVGRYPREAAFVELRNLLATTPFHQVRESDVASILAKAKLLPRDAVAELSDIYENAAHLMSIDRRLDETDRQGLKALQRAFELTDAAAHAALERAVGHVFQGVMSDALADGRFTPEERATLDETARTLGMDEALTKRLYSSAAIDAVQRAFNTAIADRRYTGREEQGIQDLATALGVTLQFDHRTQAIIDRSRVFGRIEEGDLPSVASSFILQRGETCHFTAAAVHKEMRTVTKRVNYSGPTASLKIMKGVRWRVGSIAVQRITQDVLAAVDSGTLSITSRKVMFQGARKNSTIPLGKVVHFIVFTDGIQIQKESGKDLFAIGSADWELAGACLEGAIKASR